MNTHHHKLQVMDDETREYQELSSSIKFKQNLVQGLGAATVFGIAAAGGHALFDLAIGAKTATTIAATTSTVASTAATTAATASTAAPVAAVAATGFATVLPWIGIAALVVLGIGCLYFASKYYAESVRLDQNHQARQIARGINGVAPVVEQKPTVFPAQENAIAALDKAQANTPSTTVGERMLAPVADLSSETPSLEAADKAWAARMVANENQPPAVSARA